MRVAIAAVLALALVQPAFGHSWYAPFCCTGKDCAPLPDDASVIDTGKGYQVAYVSPLTGKMVTGYFTYEQVKPSQDGQIHGCENPQGGMRCLYMPFSS